MSNVLDFPDIKLIRNEDGSYFKPVGAYGDIIIADEIGNISDVREADNVIAQDKVMLCDECNGDEYYFTNTNHLRCVRCGVKTDLIELLIYQLEGS